MTDMFKNLCFIKDVKKKKSVVVLIIAPLTTG